jgi:hypothetical protein
MSSHHVLSETEVLRLPPMLFGSIRWPRGLGAPVGDPCSGFKIIVDEHTVSQFRIGASGPEVIPGTGKWINVTQSAPCWATPDDGEMHVVRFNVPDVHLNGFPDGKYRVAVELTGNWSENRLQVMLGYRRIDPLSWYVSLTKDRHLVSVDFEVVHEPWRFRA